MGSIDGVSNTSVIKLFKAKAAAFETTLQKILETFKEIILDAELIEHELETCGTELLAQKQKCERKLCCSAAMYEKTLESRNNIIHLAASTAIRIDETKDLSMLPDLLKILCGDIEMLTPPTELQDNKENASRPVISTPNKHNSTPNKHKIYSQTKSNSPVKKKKNKSPKKELNTSLEDVSFKDDSVSEIEGTPGTGRTSPIIQSKKLKSSSSINSSGTSTDSRDKKKCPNNWNTPEAKQVKLCSVSSPKRIGKGKALRQSRLNIVFAKASTLVDLTCSPEISGGSGTSGNSLGTSENTFGTNENLLGIGTNEKPFGTSQNSNVANQNPQVQILIKKEPSENDDTILPSPTSGPTNMALSRTKENKNFKKPLSLSRVKKEVEKEEVNSPIIQFVEKTEKKSKNTTKENELTSLDESINILKPNRFAKSPHKQIKQENSPAKLKPLPQTTMPTQSPVKTEQLSKVDPIPMDEDITRCEESSMSILHHVNKLEQEQNSPSKRPLGENQNVVNVSADPTSPQPRDNGIVRTTLQDNHKRKAFENVEPVYKEPTVRKKADKLALPAWVCDECKNFFGDLYEDEPEKLARVLDRCSKHRGRNNPARPKTPPGFWNPRWTVPENTEEFNRRNNAE